MIDLPKFILLPEALLVFMSIKSLLIPALNQAPQRTHLSAFEAGKSIPRIIHQTFYDRKLPERLQANVTQLRELNPGWEYRFYDDADIAAFIQEHYPPVVWDYYQRIDTRYGAARADMFRYLLMYKIGGVYLDIKSGATRPLDSVLQPDDRFILSKWHTASGEFEHWGLVFDLRHLLGGEYQQWHIICAPGHPFLKAVLEQVFFNIDKYDPYLHQTGKRGTLRVTGPVPYTLAIERIRSQYPHRVVDSRNALGLEYNVIDGDQGHVKVFKGHYSLQTAPIVKLTPLKRQLSRVYGLAQFLHDRLVRRHADTKLEAVEKPGVKAG
jgi:mannosyltransferase OCH1-like enzyme